MAQQIRTRIQRAIELFRDDDEVYMPALELPALHMGQRRAQHVDTYRVDKQSAFEELVAMSFLPTFVLDEELVQLANQKDYELSLLELKEGGFLQLPFKSAMYEWSGRSTSGKMVHAIVNLIDINHPDTIGQDTLPEHVRAARGWYDCAAHVYKIERDDDGEYVVISPSVLYLGINRHEDGTPWLRMSGEPAWWLDDNHENRTRAVHVQEGCRYGISRVRMRRSPDKHARRREGGHYMRQAQQEANVIGEAAYPRSHIHLHRAGL